MATYGWFFIHLKDTVYENMLMTCRAGPTHAKQSVSSFPSFPLKHKRVDIWFIGVLSCRFKWACSIRITEGRIFSSVVNMQKPSSPQSLCLPTKSDLLLSYPDYGGSPSPRGFHFVSHFNSTPATIRSKLSRLRGFYANLCTKNIVTSPFFTLRNTHFKKKPFYSLMTKLRTVPLLPAPARGDNLRSLSVNIAVQNRSQWKLHQTGNHLHSFKQTFWWWNKQARSAMFDLHHFHKALTLSTKTT